MAITSLTLTVTGMDGIEDQIDAIDTRVTATEGRLTVNEGGIATNLASIGTLNTELDAAEARILVIENLDLGTVTTNL